MKAITIQDTRHGEPGNTVLIPSGTLVELEPADNMPDDSHIKWWATVPDKSTMEKLEIIGIGLGVDDVQILAESTVVVQGEIHSGVLTLTEVWIDWQSVYLDSLNPERR